MRFYRHHLLFTFAGALFLCFFSAVEKGIIGTPLSVDMLFLPALLGGLCGLLISLRERRLKKEIRSRLRTEKRLAEKEKQQRTIFDSLGVGTLIIDPSEKKIVKANPAAARILGAPPDQIIGKTCHDYICPAGEEDCLINCDNQNIHDNQRIFFGADGSEISVLTTVVPIQFKGRRHFLFGLIDNSKRWEIEKQLRKTVERFTSLTNNLKVGYFRSTPGLRGGFIFVNESICKMFGYESKEAIKKVDVADLYEDPGHRKEITDKIVQNGYIKNEKIRLKRKDGSLLIGSVSTVAVKNDMGEIAFFDGIIEDVTERELISEKLRKSEKRYEELFNSVTDLIYTQDLEGRFTSANKALKRLFGGDPDMLIGCKAKVFMKPEFASLYESEYLDGIKKNGHHEGVTSYLTKTGDKIYLEYRSTLVKPEEGEPFISGIARDVTERILAQRKIKSLQQQIFQAQKMEAIGTLAGGIAHDFNNILSAVIGYTELALLDVKEESRLHKTLSEILAAGQRASDLVKQILAFSRHSKAVVKPVHLNPLVKEALKMLRSTIPASIDIKENVDGEFLTIKADPTQIHQVVVNLVTNAFQAVNEDGGAITVQLKPFVKEKEDQKHQSDWLPGRYAKLTVSDNGAGISKAHIDQIFDPYFTTKEKHKGTGLGLSVVHGIVKSCKGHITVKSEVGRGTTFTIYFPIAGQAEEFRPTQLTGPLPVGSERILFVDDEPDIVNIQKQILEQLGYTVTGRTSSTEALAAFRSMPNRFDLVISDMTMSHLSGDKLLEAVKKIRPDIPVILCTGFSEKLDSRSTSGMNIDGFLMKPVDKRMMAVTIERVLRAQRAKSRRAVTA